MKDGGEGRGDTSQQNTDRGQPGTVLGGQGVLQTKQRPCPPALSQAPPPASPAPWTSDCTSLGLHNGPRNNNSLFPRLLCESPIAAVTNDHKLSDLKQHKFIILQLWRSEVQNGS